ncbi:MAG: hypothetical protein AAF990_08505 [Bacteroidota bacterium]
MKDIKILTILSLCCLFFLPAQAQYFGQNKPRYERFDFEVYQSPHFEIYHYLDNKELLNGLTQDSENWYDMHQAVLRDTFDRKNPIVFYNDHADFQQTNTISSSIGVGTGGVTESFKNRVIMPLTMSAQQTHHVLGHELVHAFQYNMVINGDSTNIRSFRNLPLWMVEGMAEYMSIGRVDAHTAMWMRDAVLNDDVPSIRQLQNPKYFPYRYGQAFWAFLTGLYGDNVIQPFFMATAKYGMDAAIRKVLRTDSKSLSSLWVSTLKKHYGEMMDGRKEKPFGRKLLHKENAGRLNLSPVLSPNGRYVLFFSEKSLFSLDLFLADARTGKIIRKVASTLKDSGVDDFNSFESAGTWSPNSKSFALVAVKKGKNILLIKNVENGKTLQEIEIPGVPAISNPSWSPDGKSIVLTGLVNGQPDLYLYNLKRGTVEQLTNDSYSELQARWLDDGSQIVFTTDFLSRQRGRVNGKWTYNLAILHTADNRLTQLDVFPGADNLNPHFDREGDIVFVSNRDGYRNIYRYDIGESKVYQLTDLLTGVSGITPYAPAISLDGKRDRLLYAHYFQNGYTVYQTQLSKIDQQEVDSDAVDFAAATLPVLVDGRADWVNQNLRNLDRLSKVSTARFSAVDYKPKFKLDYIGGGAGIGVGSNSVFGPTTGLAGGVDLLFSDILGDHQLYTGLSLNGEIQDFGGQVQYVNRKNRIAWGATLSHVPLRTGSSFFAGERQLNIGEGQTVPAQLVVSDLVRIFENRAGLFAQLPISKSMRFEAGASLSRYSYRIDRFNNYYNDFGRLIFQERERLDAPEGFFLGSVNAAFVGDNSRFGIASPLAGQRYRIGAERFFGQWDFYRFTADYRKYAYLKPVSLAFRALHVGNYGKDANQLINNYYAGNSIFVRGYNINSFEQLQEWGLDFDQLTGSKLLVTNFEIRFPFTGPERLSAFKSNLLLSELTLFADGGMAFNSFENNQATPIFSAGVAARVNLFGAIIVEPFYAFPIQKNTRGVFGLNIIPGW